ncbi:hypothetical protein DE146DRAFT_666046 [Phaeosphaeria sp. MPI-PUGE-AT-0046c]|nr:hypothetical protein DE146DRAFT_666046 [Phaeosphaeria sp. MPI-PUGE-AT-0046c]
MVYRGRPSAACFLCRERRIKCDKKEPKCSQCARMRVACPGYRNALDQNFRDESKRVVERAEGIYRKPGQSVVRSRDANSSADTATKTNEVIRFGQTSSRIYPVSSLSNSLENVAIAYFMSAYVPASHFDYLPSMYALACVGSTLSTTVHAVSIASLSRQLDVSEITHLARQSYSTALQQTNSALADPCFASSDSTLVSVLLLSLFEAFVWGRTRTPDSWAMHTNGAFALIKLRGLQQFGSPAGRQLFAQVTNIICVGSLQQKTRLPAGLEDLVEAALQFEPDFPPYRLACLTSQVVSLVVEVHAGVLAGREALDTARQLDDKYELFAESLPSTWKYLQKQPTWQLHDLPGTVVHQYPSYRAAQLWNSCRMIRILLNEVIHAFTSASHTFSDFMVQRQAVENIERMATLICASVPQTTVPGELVTNKASSTSFLWPLSAVRGASLASDAVRTFAVERLKYFATESRISQAGDIALQGPGFDALQDGLHMFYVS